MLLKLLEPEGPKVTFCMKLPLLIEVSMHKACPAAKRVAIIAVARLPLPTFALALALRDSWAAGAIVLAAAAAGVASCLRCLHQHVSPPVQFPARKARQSAG